MKKILEKKEIIIIIGLVIFLISIPFIIGGMVKVHEWEKPISIDNWLLYYATIGGALIGGFITSVGLYITIKQTREIQKENKTEINNERKINKYKVEIDYLKSLYEESYAYEKYLTNNLEDIFQDTINRDAIYLAANIKNITSDIFNNISNFNRNIKILSVCVQSDEVDRLIDLIENLETCFISETSEVFLNSKKYTKEKISDLFSKDGETFYALILLLIKLNTEIIYQVKAKKQEFDKLCE